MRRKAWAQPKQSLFARMIDGPVQITIGEGATAKTFEGVVTGGRLVAKPAPKRKAIDTRIPSTFSTTFKIPRSAIAVLLGGHPDPLVYPWVIDTDPRTL